MDTLEHLLVLLLLFIGVVLGIFTAIALVFLPLYLFMGNPC